MGILQQMAGGSTSPGTYGGIGQNNPALSSLAGMGQAGENPGIAALQGVSGAGDNPGIAALRALMGGGANPAAGVLSSLTNGGTNSAIPGLSALGNGQFSGGGENAAAGYDKSVIDGKFLGANPGADYYKRVLGGEFLDAGNPYLQGMVDKSNNEAQRRVNARFSASGMGAGTSSPFVGVLGKALADSENSLRYTDYNAERDRMAQAGGQADAAFANERGNMESSSGRISSNFQADQNRALQQDQLRLAALGQLSGAENQRFSNQLGAGTALGNLYNQDADRQLSGATALGSLFGQDADRRLSAGTAIGSLYGQDADRRLSASTSLGSLYNQGQGLQLQGQQAQDQAFQSDRAAQLGAASQLGQQFNAGNSTALGAAGAADSAQQAQYAQMLSALGLTGGLEGAQYAGIDPTLALGQFAANSPWTGINAFAGALGNLSGRYGTQTGTSTQGMNVFGSLLNAGANVGAGFAAASDMRLKENIQRVGQTDDGLGVYTYNFRGSPKTEMGVIAQEVAIKRPDALGPVIGGVMTVRYDKLAEAA